MFSDIISVGSLLRCVCSLISLPIKKNTAVSSQPFFFFDVTLFLIDAIRFILLPSVSVSRYCLTAPLPS